MQQTASHVFSCAIKRLFRIFNKFLNDEGFTLPYWGPFKIINIFMALCFDLRCFQSLNFSLTWDITTQQTTADTKSKQVNIFVKIHK